MLIERRILLLPLTLLLALGLIACQAADEPAAATVEPTATTVPVDEPVDDVTATEPPTEESAAADSAVATPELADILTIVSRAEGLEALATYVEQTGLTDELQGDGPFTLLLPTSAAFEELPETVRNNNEQMRTILQEHIVAGTYLLNDMIGATGITNLNGNELDARVGQTGGTISGSNILGGDFEAKNGLIHIIDTVILPPSLEEEILAHYEPLVGESLEPMQGNNHIGNNELSPVVYSSTPPTSGPHYPNIAPWSVHEKVWPYEQLLHNLEDAGIVIYYQCPDDCSELVAELSAFAQPYIDGGRHLLVAPNDPSYTTPDGTTLHKDMGAPIVITAWRRLLKLDEFDADQLSAFIEAFEGIDHHVK